MYLLGEHYSPIQEGGDQVVDKQVNFGGVVFLKVVIHLQPLYHPAGQHSICLPALVILTGQTH